MMKQETMPCPKGHRTMVARSSNKTMAYRGIEVGYRAKYYRCTQCGIEAATVEQTSVMQKAIADAYRAKTSLLTGGEIVEGRKKLKLTQQALADRMQIGVASLKRWEGSIIQSRSMDRMLREALAGRICGDPYTGNRPFSIPRVRLVLKHFEAILGRKIMKKNDKMLFAAKYLWYADMTAFRKTGEGITGATYAALPFGPQMNNYRELIDDIRRAGDTDAEPLSEEEKGIIVGIAQRFPQDQMVYDASHREVVWKEKAVGSLIPYSDAARFKEI